MFRGSTGFRKPGLPPVGGSPDFSLADFGTDFATSSAAVFDDTAYLFGTDDNGTVVSENNYNFRIIVGPSAFSAAGSQKTCQLEFRFGTLCTTVSKAIGSVYFGQAGTSLPNFAGDQVQVKFSGAATVNSSAAGVVLSDVFTLAQNFDVTKNYICAFFVASASVSLSTSPNDPNVTLWTDKGAVGSNQSALTVPTTASYSSTASNLSFLEKIII